MPVTTPKFCAPGTALAQVYDPLRYGVDLPMKTALWPLGFALELSTNSPEVALAAEESWGGFPKLFPAPPIQFRIAVDEDDPAGCPSSLVWRAQRNMVAMVSDAGNFAVCDLSAQFAFCWVTKATAANRPWFRYYLLDTMVFVNLIHSRVTRLHAACVAIDGRGLVLCGESGAGKTCLAYACARRGWTLITDEVTLLLRNSRERLLLGKPRQMHFRETAADLLPELRVHLAAPNPVGKMTIEVHTATLSGITTGFQCRAASVVFLNRHAGGPARLVPLSKSEARRRLEQDLPLFDQPVHEQHRASLENLLEVESYELRYRELNSAVNLLESLVR
jgi:hypothetical protein